MTAQKPAGIRIPPRGTKGANMPGGAFLMRLAKPLIDRQVDGYRRAKGPEPKLFMGFPTGAIDHRWSQDREGAHAHPRWILRWD